jgi:hypothetical protein
MSIGNNFLKSLIASIGLNYGIAKFVA